MSFQSPWLLLALLVLPVAVAAYAWSERRRRGAELAFATAATLPSAAPRRPGWRRHAPIAAYGVALAALLVALARPQVTVAVSSERASVMLVTDQSGSMAATDVAPSRMSAARAAAMRFLESVPDRVRVGAIAFDHAPHVLHAPTADRDVVRRALERVRPRGGTATGEALAAALGALGAAGGTTAPGGNAPGGTAPGGAAPGRDADNRAPAAIVMLSDGRSTHGRAPLAIAERARRLGVPVYTVSLGTPNGSLTGSDGVRRPVTPDPRSLAAIARASGGASFDAADADELNVVYERLGSRLGHQDEPREVTAAFAGGALLLVAAGALLSLRWFRRLV